MSTQTPLPAGEPLAIAIPRQLYHHESKGTPGLCPRCSGKLETSSDPLIVALVQPGSTEVLPFVTTMNGLAWYCRACPTVTVVTSKIVDIARSALPEENQVASAVIGVVDLAAIPEDKRHLPISQIEDPPIARFTMPPRKQAAAGPDRPVPGFLRDRERQKAKKKKR